MKMTDQDIRKRLNTLSEYLTWRGMTALYEGINHATLYGYASGRPIVNSKHRQIFGLDALVKVEPCPTCGLAHTYDCTKQRPVNVSQPRNLNRCTFYPTTATAKIVEDLYAVTGKRFALVEGELEY